MRLNVRCTALPNGVRVVTAEMPGLDSLAVGLWAAVGSRHEPRRLGGACHFIEHLLFKGSRRRSARAISQAIEGRGGYFNGFTQEEATCYYARIAAEHGAEALDILFDMYLHPRLDPADVEKERGVIVEEIMMYRDQPGQLVQEMLGELVWADHPLGRPLVGTEKTVGGMRRQDILAFRRRHYVPANTVVALAGRTNHEESVRLVERLTARWAPGRPPSFAPVDRATRQVDAEAKSKEIEQAHLALAFRLFGRYDPRRYALKLLSIILGENMSSRLFQVVREKHGLAYSIQSSIQLFRETGLLCVQAGVDCERLARALDLVLAEIDRLRQRAVGGAELRRAKDYARGQLRIGLESASNQMMWAGENLVTYGRVVQPGEVLARLDAVTAEEMLAVARQVFTGRRASLALIAPGDAGRHRDLLRAKLHGMGPVRRL